MNGLTHMPDVLPPVHSSEDWQAAFGFPPCQDEQDDLVRYRINTLLILIYICFICMINKNVKASSMKIEP